MNPTITKVLVILAAIAVYTLAATLLSGSDVVGEVKLLAGLIAGLAFPQLGKKAE
jgi:hypothetical protein